MKKIVMSSMLLTSVFIISGCSSNVNGAGSTNSGQTTKKTGEIASTTEKEMGKDNESNPIFEGSLSSNPVTNKDTVVLSFESVDVVNDPDSIHDILDSNGVILNVDKNLFKKTPNSDKIKDGVKIEFTLTKSPALTFSIPPQVPGNSIESLRVLDH